MATVLQTPAEPAPSSSDAEIGVTLRSILLGLGAVAIVNPWIPYSEYIVRSSRMNLSHFPVSIFILFLFLLYVINPLLRVLPGARALARTEFLVVLAIGLLGSVIPGSGVLGFLLGAIATPYYFANPENRWSEFFHDHMDPWLVPPDADGAMRDFYEGAQPGTAVPWEVWIPPLAWWMVFIAVTALVTACIAVILRKQWSEYERLTFPLLSPVLEMCPSDKRGEGLVKNGPYWIGFGLTLSLMLWNTLTFFWQILPEINLSLPFFYFARGFPPIFPRFNLYIMGFAYFANVDVLFSMWFSHFIWYQIPGGILNRVGFAMDGRGDPYGSLTFSGAGWLCFGAMFFFVFWGLWIGRRHLITVWQKAFDTNHPADDSREMLSYRAAVFGILIGTPFLGFWLYQSGMSVPAIFFYLLGTFVIYVGVARIVAQTGVLFIQAPISAQVFTIYTLGARSLTTSTMTSLALSYTLTNYIRGLFMPALVHIAKLSESIRGATRRWLLGVVFLGAGVGCIAFILYVIPLGYERGAFNFNDIPLKSGTNRIYPIILSKIVNPFDTDWVRLGFFGGGAALMGILTLLRYRFSWWPLHPIGLTMCSTNVARSNQVSLFLVWAAKLLILKFGGVAAYRRFQPFFVGMLTGYSIGVTLSFLVDAIWFSGQGHYVHRW